MWAYALVLALAAGTIAAILIPGRLQAQRRRELRRTDNDLLRARLSRTRAWQRLPVGLRPKLEERVRIFIAEREFIGCGGLRVTEPMKLAVAADACLLLLGHDRHVYDALRAVLIYPDEFVVEDSWEEDGVVTEEVRPLSGQMWDSSRVILSWKDIELADSDYNVVLHEFAHYHDHVDDIVAGPIGRQWRAATSLAQAALAAAQRDDRQTAIDDYGLESGTELFAVSTEAFIEDPVGLNEDYPAVYQALSALYGIDPLLW